jgi:two-component system response regulator AtoC
MKIIRSWYNFSMNIELNALIIDDDPQIRGLIADILKTANWHTEGIATFEEAVKSFEEKEWALIFCDVLLKENDGYSILKYFNEKGYKGIFVLMTGFGSAVGALDATAIGAYDYLVKPFTVDEVLRIAEEASQCYIASKLQEEGSETETTAYVSDIPLIGKSPKFLECLKLVGRIAKSRLPVLITGESGTGKEIVARAIHLRSDRSSKPFVVVNCGAIPGELIESELFGHVKGAFTGADRDRRGLWEEANGGTIFLDEITETTPFFQVKLLRVLQENEIRPVGSSQTRKVNARVLAATNRNIEEEVKANRFRQDLMYRLNTITIHLPPLRERVEDIPLLAKYFASKVAEETGRKIRISQQTMEILKSYPWFGNVRELENAILRAASLADNIIRPEHLPSNIVTFVKKEKKQIIETLPIQEETDPFERFFKTSQGQWFSLAEMQKKYAKAVLASTKGNKQAAARILKIDRKTLLRIVGKNP